MEGIAGIVYPDVFQMNDMIHPMLLMMKHRGKEPFDVHTHKNIQIGICGSKLAGTDTKSVFVGFTGYLDYPEKLREQLIEQGCRKANTPSELVLQAYCCWDSSFVEHLSGNFAILVLDQQKKRIILARDRIGKMPLYWYYDQYHFIFGSELKSLLATGAIPQTPALDALASYLYFGYIPQDMTPIAGINKLLPGHYLQFNFDGSMAITPYWSYSSFFEKTFTKPKNEIVEYLNTLLKDSVKASLPKEQSYGCALSGGIGSASVAYYLSKIAKPISLPSFSVGFRGQNEQDVKAGELASKALGMIPHVHYIEQKNFLDDFVKIAWYLDEPLADPNIIATWKLAEIASKHVQVIYSGMGSDELLAGHSRYSIEEQESSSFHEMIQSSLSWLRGALYPLFSSIYRPAAFKIVKKARTNPSHFEYLSHNAIFNEQLLADASPKLANIFDPEIFLHKFHNLNRIKSTVSSFLYFDIKTRLPDCYIMQYERLTAAHGLEWNTPFLNRKLVEFAASLPEPEILQEQDTAAYLKTIFKDIFPSSFLNRPKKTRRNFLRPWLQSPQMKQLFLLLHNGALVDSGLISARWIQNQIDELEFSPNAFRFLWTVFALEIWFRLFINNPIQTNPPDVSVKQLLIETP